MAHGRAGYFCCAVLIGVNSLRSHNPYSVWLAVRRRLIDRHDLCSGNLVLCSVKLVISLLAFSWLCPSLVWHHYDLLTAVSIWQTHHFANVIDMRPHLSIEAQCRVMLCFGVGRLSRCIRKVEGFFCQWRLYCHIVRSLWTSIDSFDRVEMTSLLLWNISESKCCYSIVMWTWPIAAELARLVAVIVAFERMEEDCFWLFENSQRKMRLRPSGVNLAHCFRVSS